MIQPNNSYMPSNLPPLRTGERDLDALLAQADKVTLTAKAYAPSESLSNGLERSLGQLQQTNSGSLPASSGTGLANIDAVIQQQTLHLTQALAMMKNQGGVSASSVDSASLGAKSNEGVYFGKAANAPASNFSSLTSDGKRMMEALKNPKVRAFLDALAVAELGKEGAAKGGYGKFFGDHGTEETFSNEQLAKGHPDQVRSSGGLGSSATGRYQFLTPTWRETAAKLGLQDMMPQSQELAAVALLEKRGILDEVQAGNFDAAFNEAGKEWASLEGNPYGQGTKEGSKVAFMSQVQNSLA
jgi:muramidase (phage lysozyme)